jgi:hypothetical protein
MGCRAHGCAAANPGFRRGGAVGQRAIEHPNIRLFVIRSGLMGGDMMAVAHVRPPPRAIEVSHYRIMDPPLCRIRVNSPRWREDFVKCIRLPWAPQAGRPAGSTGRRVLAWPRERTRCGLLCF